MTGIYYWISAEPSYSITIAQSPHTRTEPRYINALSVACSHTHPTAAQPHAACCVDQKTTVSGITESWGLKLLCCLLCLQGSDTEEKGVPVLTVK